MIKSISLSTVAAFLAVVTSLGSSVTANAEEKKTKPSVKVTVPSGGDDMNNPNTWQPEIVVSGIKTAGDLQQIKTASYRKKTDRTSAAYKRKMEAMSVIHEKYGKERRELLETLKAEDPAAAFYWLERSAFLLDMNGREADVEPTSPAYLKFAKALREIDKRQNPEEKKIEVAYDAALKRADEIHDAETAKAEELYADARQKP